MPQKSQSWRAQCLLENMYALNVCLTNESSEDTDFQSQTLVNLMGGDLAGGEHRGQQIEGDFHCFGGHFFPFTDP